MLVRRIAYAVAGADHVLLEACSTENLIGQRRALTSDEARELAAELVEAADELDNARARIEPEKYEKLHGPGCRCGRVRRKA